MKNTNVTNKKFRLSRSTIRTLTPEDLAAAPGGQSLIACKSIDDKACSANANHCTVM